MVKKKSGRARHAKSKKRSGANTSIRSSRSGRQLRQRDKLAADSLWSTFEQSHRDHPAVGADVVYALPDRLLDHIAEHAPGFFAEAELAFEKDLSTTAGSGFFLKQPFFYPLLPSWDRSPGAVAAAERYGQADREIKALMETEMKRSGRSPTQIEEFFQKQEELKERVRERQLGYAGWLVTHANYRTELCKLVARWEKRIRRSGGFPSLPVSIFGERPPKVPKRDRAFYSDLMRFYQRWGLETLASWHLPIPLRPQLTTPNLYSLSALGEAGLTTFVPWHLLRFKDIDIYEFAATRQLYHAPDHLREWLAKGNARLGHQRYGLMLQLYIILELCLKPRYGEALRRQTDKLTHAVAAFLSERHADSVQSSVVNPETLRKLRREMNRRLRECHEHLDALEA